MTQGTLLQYFSKVPASTGVLSLASQPSSTPAEPSRTRLEAPAERLDVLATTTEQSEFRITSSDSAAEADLQGSTLIPNVRQAIITRVSAEHLESLKRLTSNILPVRYPDKFYNAILLEPEAADFSRVVLYHDKPVGWIRCRLEPISPESDTKQIYIQALCILAPYREQGFATHLLKTVLQPALLRKYGVRSIYAHVWESNEDALEWYQRRGFKQILLIGQYYKRLKPAGAWIVRKDLGVLDHISKDG